MFNVTTYVVTNSNGVIFFEGTLKACEDYCNVLDLGDFDVTITPF
jgi:hypothetical protein